MTPCPKCASIRIFPMIGIFYGIDNAPHHAAFNCRCGDTRGIVWAECTEEQRREALNAELARTGTSEMMMREG